MHLEDSLDMPLKQVLEIIQLRIMNQSTYFGVRTFKSPLDFWVYQELLHELRPDVIVEIGNCYGGSTLALAHLCDALGVGRVIGVDLNHGLIADIVRAHPRITLIESDAIAAAARVRELIAAHERVLIIEDSAHTYENTLGVLRAYAGLVSAGSYFIVEDGICHHGLDVGPQPGPYEAVEAFMAEAPDFQVDRSRESFLVTWNPKGFLKRIDGPGKLSP